MGREVKRVPLDFNWPLKKTWEGYICPYRPRKCQDCENGYSPQAKVMIDQWYGNAPFDPVAYGAVPITPDHPAIINRAARNCANGRDYRINSVRMESRRLFEFFRKQWSHHLIQADVDALIADDRLYDLTHTCIAGQGWKPIVPAPSITAEMVNDWSLRSPMGHDSLNMSVCVRARCKREGVPYECQTCGGTNYDPTDGQTIRLSDEWSRTEPPEGEGWQVWETTTEGSPISRVGRSPEELAQICVDDCVSVGGYKTATYEQWLKFIKAGWAPSMVIKNGVSMSGVEAASELA